MNLTSVDPSTAPPIAPKSAFVLASKPALGAALAAGLADLGCRTLLVTASAASRPLPEGVTTMTADFGSRAAIESALTEAIGGPGGPGGPDLIVLAILPAASLQAVAVEEMDGADWNTRCELPLKHCLFALQACQGALGNRPAALVGIGPTVGFIGAPRLTALCAALEGQRALFKSAARQSGARGITLNWIAVASAVFAPELAQAELTQVPELGPPPLPLPVPRLREEIAPVAWFFATKVGRAMTGATIDLDGGEWMLP